LSIQITGNIETLVIDHSITAAISLNGGSVKQLQVTDSILQSINPATPPIDLPLSSLNIQRTTLFGPVNRDRLSPHPTIFTWQDRYPGRVFPLQQRTHSQPCAASF
jgi:hypothetical protein